MINSPYYTKSAQQDALSLEHLWDAPHRAEHRIPNRMQEENTRTHVLRLFFNLIF